MKDEYSSRARNERALSFSKLITTPKEIQDRIVATIRVQVPPMEKDGTIVYDRWSDSYYEKSGLMARRTTTVYQGMHRPDNPYFIIPDRSYEYDFRDTLTDRDIALIEHTRNRIREWHRSKGNDASSTKH